MVIARISMGLGNQMFQYAAARALSLKLSQQLKIDTSSYKGYQLRKCELGEFFNINPQEATEKDLSGITLSHPVRRLWNMVFPGKRIRGLPYEESTAVKMMYRLFSIASPPHKRSVYEERQFHFDKNFFSTPSNVYLKGYWMSWKYFEDYKQIIKSDYSIRQNLVNHLQAQATEMSNSNSIALHIRCSDRKNAANLALYGEIQPSYFKEGVEYIEALKGRSHLYVFSDDINAAKGYIPAGRPCTFISGIVTKSAIEDFYLMTLCKNIIIPNSTFSWWAAYLNQYDDKIVIAPQRWYNQAPYDYKDVCYPTWVKLPN